MRISEESDRESVVRRDAQNVGGCGRERQKENQRIAEEMGRKHGSSITEEV